MSCLVDYTGKISTLLEDLKKVDLFAQSVGPARYSDIYSDFVVRKPKKVVRKLEKVGRKSYLCKVIG
jgi:hypothetical protein